MHREYMQELEALLPHRATMLLLTRVIEVGDRASASEIHIDRNSSFFMSGKGVPAWVGLEYMGQTAALIAGHQLAEGTIQPHLGLLLGTRKYQANVSRFEESWVLVCRCEELAVVGNGLATFRCEIVNKMDDQVLATANLTVFRKPVSETEQ